MTGHRYTIPTGSKRVAFLTSRARQRGFAADADLLEEEWTEIGRAMGVAEDHHGFYDPRAEALITARVDEMLAEVDPRECTVTEATAPFTHDTRSPVLWLNEAWRRYRNSPADYPEWEVTAVREFLDESVL